MLIIRSRSIFNLKYDIVKDQKIGQVFIPFTRLLRSIQFGDIIFSLYDEIFKIRIPLKGETGIGFVASGYRLLKNDSDLATTTFPQRGTPDPFFINWDNKKIFVYNSDKGRLVHLNDKVLGTLNEQGVIRKEATLNIGTELPDEIQVFIYFAYLQYVFLN